ncbi:hypothetical protein SKAU_G00414260, partial [Synaphobranchus kaupii]
SFVLLVFVLPSVWVPALFRPFALASCRPFAPVPSVFYPHLAAPAPAYPTQPSCPVLASCSYPGSPLFSDPRACPQHPAPVPSP